jgi:hypothetical protein
MPASYQSQILDHELGIGPAKGCHKSTIVQQLILCDTDYQFQDVNARSYKSQ